MVVLFCFCKKNETTTSDSENTMATEDSTVVDEMKEYKIKSITRKDYHADNKFGEFIQKEQVNRVVRRYNEDGLSYEVEIEVIDPSQARVAGDTLARKNNSNVFTYVPKAKEKGLVEMYTKAGELVEVYKITENKMVGYVADNMKEPFVIRTFDDRGNYDYQIINTGDEYLYVTKHRTIEKDERGFATKTHAVAMQFKKHDSIDYDNLNYNDLELVNKNYQVVEFKFETY